MTDHVDSLLAAFRPAIPASDTPPSPAMFSTMSTERVERRSKKEKRAQATAAQLRRKGVRTKQINFRCSPQFLEDVHALAKALECSVADVLETAIAPMLKKHMKGSP